MKASSPTNRRNTLVGLGTLGIASLAGCMGARAKNPSKPIHWHVNLMIEIDGDRRTIPKDVGIGPQYSENPFYDSGMQMTTIHTHDDSGTIHWEISGRTPKEGETILGAFFNIWGKPFSESRIFDHRTHEGELTMLVNGARNEQFDEYQVADGDDVLIRFESM